MRGGGGGGGGGEWSGGGGGGGGIMVDLCEQRICENSKKKIGEGGGGVGLLGWGSRMGVNEE